MVEHDKDIRSITRGGRVTPGVGRREPSFLVGFVAQYLRVVYREAVVQMMTPIYFRIPARRPWP
jgi:hypothetical protein